MPRKRPSIPLIPKHERLQQLAAKLPDLGLDVPTVAAYLALVSVAAEIAAANDEYFARRGLSEGRFIILVILLEHLPAAVAPSELAELSGATRGNVTGLIDSLERDGHVVRQSSHEDRRVTPIALTASGEELAQRLMAERTDRTQTLMRRLSVGERSTLVSLLAKLRDGLPEFRDEE